MAVAALRPDRAAQPATWQKISTVCRNADAMRRSCLAQREAGSGALSPVHAVRCRYGRHGQHRRRRRDLHARAADTLEALGIKRGDYVIKVNNRKVLDGVMEAIGLGGDENAGRRLTVLRAIDKLDKFGPEGVRQLLGAGRRNESGDFTRAPGAGRRTD